MKINHTYKLAVIIPCWKCEKEIAEMLDCILQQTFQDWHVFCIDDQSPDGTAETLEQYAQKDPRIHFKIRDREPKGAQTCRNMGFSLSEGAEYVIWLDADDLIAPYCFEQRVRYMDNHKELDFGIFPAKNFTTDIWDKDSGKCYGFPFFDDSLQAMLTWLLPMVGWTNIYRRKSILDYQLKWDENILSMQDSDFNIQGILKGLKYNYAVKEWAKVDLFHRFGYNPTSIAQGIHSPAHFKSHIYLLNKITESLNHDQLIYYKKDLELYFFKFAIIIKKQAESYKQFIKLPWVKKNISFYIRLWLWRFFRFHFGYSLIFRNLNKKRISTRNDWYSRMIEKTNDIINSKNWQKNSF